MDKFVFIFIICLLFQSFSPIYALAQDDVYAGKEYKKVIMIDLDGVLNNYSKYDKTEFRKLKQVRKILLKNLIKQVSMNWYCLRLEVLNLRRSGLLKTKLISILKM